MQVPSQVEYERATSVQHALSLLSLPETRVVAGGHSLIPMMKLRLAAPAHLVDLGGVTELAGVRREGGDIVIGATTTQGDLIASALLAEALPIIRETALVIADPQVRALGTIGGNAAQGDPGNDMPALMQCLDARYVLTSAGGARTVAARDGRDKRLHAPRSRPATAAWRRPKVTCI